MDNQVDKITKAEASDWIRHPVTKHFFKLLWNSKVNHEEGIKALVLGANKLGPEESHVLAQIKGRLLNLEEILDIKEFLLSEDAEDEA